MRAIATGQVPAIYTYFERTGVSGRKSLPGAGARAAGATRAAKLQELEMLLDANAETAVNAEISANAGVTQVSL